MSSEFSFDEMQRYKAFGEIAGKLSGQLEKACRTCVLCQHFDDTKELCGLNFLRPPAMVIAFGCECFEQEVPF